MNVIQVQNLSLCPKGYVHTQCPLLDLRVSRVRVGIKGVASGRKCLRLSPVCLSRSGNGDQDPLWKSFGKALENFGKKSSVEDLLKQQIEKREYYDGDGPGGKPPGRGGGGGGGGGFGDFEEEGPGVLDETIQVILATLGFIFVYTYIISGEEIARVCKDYIKYKFGGQKSIRLARVLYQWETFIQHLKSIGQKEEVDKFWLEKAIVNTPTWWDHPDKYREFLRGSMEVPYRSEDE